MRRALRISVSDVTNPIQDMGRWWPVLLIGPAVFAIRISGLARWFAFGLLMAIAAMLVVQLVHRRRKILFTRQTALFGGFLVWAAASLTWSPDVVRGLRFVLMMAVAFLAYVWGRIAGPPGGGSQLWWAGSAGLGLAAVALVFIPDPPAIDHLNPDRILAMGVIALVVAGWYGPRSRWYTATIGLVGLATIVVSSSRMSLLVGLLLLLTAPGLRLPRAGRVLLAASLVTLAWLATTTTGFQQRWFESGEGTVLELVTLEGLATSGRFEIWPVVAETCGFTLFGHGAGAADSYSSTTHTGFPEPHNEYLRVWCDTGLVGSLLLWGFIASVAVGALRAMRRLPAPLWAQHAALQMVTALCLLSLTDNPLTTAIPFFVPAALAMGWSSGRLQLDRPESARRDG